MELIYPKHKHPHGVENKPENSERIWVCTEENNAIFTYEYLRGILLKTGFSKVERANKKFFPVKDSSAHPATMTFRCIK